MAVVSVLAAAITLLFAAADREVLFASRHEAVSPSPLLPLHPPPPPPLGTWVPLPLPGCDVGERCGRLALASGMTFNCRFAGPEQSSTNVLLLHGFPEFSSMYSPLMAQMARLGWRSLACNQRGYSEGASPADEEAYEYAKLASDAVAAATVAGFPESFHLVGHDHGGFLGWFMAQNLTHGPLLRSFTTLSSMHPVPFSQALFGPNADEQQVVASQYFTMFCLPNSSSLHNEFWFRALGQTAGSDLGFSFTNAFAFQKAMWWYADAYLLDGMVAMPPVMSVDELATKDEFVAYTRSVFGETVPWNSEGFAATHPVGYVHVPTLFVCGTADTSLLCTRPYALESANYVVDAQYTYTQVVGCGHNLLSCENPALTNQTIAAILDHIAENK